MYPNFDVTNDRVRLLLFAISRNSLYHDFLIVKGAGICSLYHEIHYIEIRYIEVWVYLFSWCNFFYKITMAVFRSILSQFTGFLWITTINGLNKTNFTFKAEICTYPYSTVPCNYIAFSAWLPSRVRFKIKNTFGKKC